MTKTTWKSIIGYEYEYEVSNNDQVRSRNRLVANARGQVRLIKSKLLKPKKDADNREYVMLRKGGCAKKCFISDLAADGYQQVEV